VERAQMLNKNALTTSLSMIKASSDELFSFNHLEVKLHDKESIQAFQPDARFLFVNTRSIWFKLNKSASIQDAEKFFELFEGGQQISFLGLYLERERMIQKFSIGSAMRARLNALHLKYHCVWAVFLETTTNVQIKFF
jgi:hypothetical protein